MPATPRFAPTGDALRTVFDRLFEAYGPQSWWPADSPFEVAVGAVLTQNAAWGNVEQAIDNLRARGLLSLEALLGCESGRIADAIRPSGYFNVKTQRLLSLCRFLGEEGGLAGFARREPGDRRGALLAVHGIGPETADDILLYALQQPVFVIDTYTRRLLQRLGLADGRESYEDLRLGFEDALGPDVALFNEFHALIVRHAKVSCRKQPDCTGCVLRALCETGRGASEG
ncbi:MAG: endonuclease [Gammaproteobacteria bacterium]|nr:endonuclease [Gammaproteobacteria bacterium]